MGVRRLGQRFGCAQALNYDGSMRNNDPNTIVVPDFPEVLIENAQAKYLEATRMGRPLEAVSSYRPPHLEFDQRARDPHRGAGITAELLRTRKNGSRFISDLEWDELIQLKPFWPCPEILRQIEILRSPWRGALPSQEANIVVVDVRPLQKAAKNGTTRHARAVTRAVAASLPAGFELAFFTNTDQPKPERDILALATIEWRPALLSRAKVFVQTATLSDPLDPLVLDLHRAPWIAQATVFLDDIMGAYPSHFIGTEEAFWAHQLGLEKIKYSSVVLSLGEASQAEAKAIWSSLRVDETQPEFVISSCVGGIPSVSNRDVPRATDSGFVVFGNRLPHKNIALPAAALGVLQHDSGRDTHFTFVSEWSVANEIALRKLAGESLNPLDVPQAQARRNSKGHRRPKHRGMLSSAGDPSDGRLIELVNSARAVIVPSMHEGFSLPVVEAIERSVPVLLSRIPAHEELLPDGPWFFDPRSVKSFLESMNHFERTGHEWPTLQATGLAEKYSSTTLERRVREAVAHCVASEPRVRLAPKGNETTTSIGGVAQRVDLVSRDRELILSKSEFLQTTPRVPRKTATPVDQQTMEPFEQKRIIEIYHDSRSWRLGRFMTLPYRLARDRAVGKR